jgi:hypothetical protein
MMSHLKTIIILLLIACISCKHLQTGKENIIPQNSNYHVENELFFKNYKVKLSTYLINDTLDVVDYKEDNYSNPIITSQRVSFYVEDKIIREFILPLHSISKRTISGGDVNALRTPIYELCLYKNHQDKYYILNGSDYCNGANCQEFIGIYTLSGDIVYEGLVTPGTSSDLKELLQKKRITLNQENDCVNIDQVIFE